MARSQVKRFASEVDSKRPIIGLSSDRRLGLLINVGAGLVIAQKMLREVFPGPLSGVGGVFAKRMAGSWEVNHVETFTGFDQGVDQAQGVGRVDVVVGFAVNEQQV